MGEDRRRMMGDIDGSNPDAIGQLRADANGDTQYIIKLDAAQLNRVIEKEITLPTGTSVLLSFDSPHNQNQLADAKQKSIQAHLSHIEYIELDAESDLHKDFLDLVPACKRIIRWQPFEGQLRHDVFLARLKQIMQTEAAIYQIITDSAVSTCNTLLHIKRARIDLRKIAVFAEAEQYAWSRVISNVVAADVLFADSFAHLDSSLEALTHKYPLPPKGQQIALYGIAGKGVSSSLSAGIHNAAFSALNIPGLYLAFPLQDLESLQQIIDGLSALGIPLKGLTTTSPLKELISGNYRAHRPIVERAQSANVLRLDEHNGYAETTDDQGLLSILHKHSIEVAGQQIAVLGCGGSGRVAAWVVSELGGRVTLFNRGDRRRELASRLLDIESLPLADFEHSDAQIIINTIPINDHELPFSTRAINFHCVIIDYNYRHAPSALALMAAARGATLIDGLEMLSMQLHAQFQALCGMPLPPEVLACLASPGSQQMTTKSDLDAEQNITIEPRPLPIITQRGRRVSASKLSFTGLTAKLGVSH
jgi:3-dehydroquinate dehydratase/shikimate dehydrogenase